MTLDLNVPWRSVPVVSIDFESTSPDPTACEPVEVSAVRFDGNGDIVGRFSTLLKTSFPIPAEATGIHGISDEMVASSPTLAEVSHELVKLSEGAVPMSFNRSYDRTIMHRYLSGEGVSMFDPAQPWLCTLAMAWSADRFESGSGRHKLTACCARRGIRVVGAHRAEADAIASGMLFYALLAKAKPETTMAQLMARVDAVEVEREADHVKFRKKLAERDRVIWREYARAALARVTAKEIHGQALEPEDWAKLAEQTADRMLKIEQERFKV